MFCNILRFFWSFENQSINQTKLKQTNLFPGVYLSKEKQVLQTPSDLLMKPNVKASLNLTHHIPSYDTILWYQRSAGDTSLKLIAYVYYQTPKVETPFDGRFSVSGDGEKTAQLHILKATHPDDSAEYFGVASIYTVIKTVSDSYKNLQEAAENKKPLKPHDSQKGLTV